MFRESKAAYYTAVEAGNYAQYKAEFTKDEDNWKQVEDGIKAKFSYS